MSRRVVSIKKRRATPYIKKRTCTAAKYEKTSKILCQNCVASLFLLRFLTFCVVRDHEAMGSNPVTPTIKNTHALFALCVFLFACNKGFERNVKKTAQCAVFSPRRDNNRVSGAKKGV